MWDSQLACTHTHTHRHTPWNLPLSLTEKTRTTLRAARNAEFSFFSLTGSVDHTPCRGQQSGRVKSSFPGRARAPRLSDSHQLKSPGVGADTKLTFALARDTFSWLLLLMRKNRASRRM